jgi:alpha-methylacyl-CoA racemase
MVDGSALLMQAVWAWRGIGDWSDERGRNLLDGGAPFYRCYRCADGRFVAVGAIETQFYADLLKGLGMAGEDLPDQSDRGAWPGLADRFAAEFATRSRDQWADVFADLDACVTPVLDFAEATAHPARGCPRGVRRPGRCRATRAGSSRPPSAPRFPPRRRAAVS